MVVIAIVAIIAAVGVPSYRSYLNRSKVSTAMSIVSSYAQNVMIQYETTGAWPDASEVQAGAGGQFLLANGYYQIFVNQDLASQLGFYYLGYYPGANNGNNPFPGFILAFLPGLDFQVDGDFGFDSQFDYFGIAAYLDDNGVWHSQCGGNISNMLHYLPSSCQAIIYR
jgi:type II secretory pathway pseudopilin PulG